jgi:hypothetical protein
VRYNETMQRRIRVDNCRPATVRDTARILGVSKKRTDELARLVTSTIYRNAKTGQFVIRAKHSGSMTTNNSSRNGSTKKVHETRSRRVKA